jgi:Uma2 family endonuclease
MSSLRTKVIFDTWQTATWDEYVQVLGDQESLKVKHYYRDRQWRIEIVPIGNDHARDHAVVMLAVSLYATFHGIDFNGMDNCSYRRVGYQEAQPDASYYLAEQADTVPYGTSIIDLERYSPPNLVIEVAKTSLADDKGEKRILYEDLGVQEYWIIDVQNVQVIAFAMQDGGSKRIIESIVLPGLAIATLNEAFRRTRDMNQRLVTSWLIEKFQQS